MASRLFAGVVSLPGALHPPGRLRQDLQIALDPPRLYLRAATVLQRAAVRLFRAGVLPRAGLAHALDWSHTLARLGLASWQQRRALHRLVSRRHRRP